MGFSGAEIRSYCDDIKNKEADIQADEINNVLDYLNEALPEKRKYLKKIHIPVVMFVAGKAQEKGVKPQEFGVWLDTFFDNLSDDGMYMAACLLGGAKRANVQTRVEQMREKLLADLI